MPSSQKMSAGTQRLGKSVSKAFCSRDEKTHPADEDSPAVRFRDAAANRRRKTVRRAAPSKWQGVGQERQ